MSADPIDHPLLPREDSDDEKSLEDGSPAGRTPSSNDSGTNGPSKSPNTSKQGNKVLDKSQQVKDGQHEMQQGKNGKTGALQEHETQGQNGRQPETPLVNSGQSEIQSEKNHQTEAHHRKDGQMQQGIKSHETSPTKNNQTEQVQGSNGCPKPETSTSRSFSDVTSGRYNPSPPYNLRSRPNAPHSTLVDFYLYVHGDQPVDDVYLLFSHEEPILLRRVGSDIKLWHYQLSLSCDLKKEYVEYRYRIFIKGHDSNVPLIGRLFSKDATSMDEIGKRNIKSNKQYDVFHFSEDRRYYLESVPQSVIFYIKWLLQSVNVSTISQILQQVEEMRFNNFTAKHVRDFIAWIVEQVIGPSVTDIQRLYLCVILGHLFQNCSTYFRFLNDNNTKKACDRLLECFSGSVHAPFLSPSSLKSLEKLASALVQNSSCPGWLNLAATFYPYLGLRYLLNERHDTGLKYKYDIKEYHKLVDTLLRNIDITEQGKNAHQSLLQTVLEIAPSNDVVVELFDRPDTDRFFADEAGKEDFFVKFYQGTHYSGRRRGVGEKLVELLKIPQKLREKLYRLVNSCLLDFVKSDEEVKEEHIKAFIDLIVLHHCLQKSQVVDLLIEISRSKSVHRLDLLLKILDTSYFREDWHNTTMTHKVKICSTWVNTKVVNETRMNSGVDKTTAVYRGMEVLMRCSLNKSNNKLAEEVSETVVQNILRSEESLSILKAFVKIDKYSTVVQDCYKTHVKEILGRDRRLMKKSVKVFEEYSSSSLGHELLSYVLDIIDVPTVAKSNVVDEAMFKNILDWCDVWTILLKTSGTSRSV